MSRGRHSKYEINLTQDDITELKQIIRVKKISKTMIRRAQILLDLDVNNPHRLTHTQASKTYGVTMTTIYNITRAFAIEGLKSTVTYKRNPNSNAHRKVDGEAEAKIIKIACSTPPAGHDRWTMRMIANETKVQLETPVGKDTIRDVLKKRNFDLT